MEFLLEGTSLLLHHFMKTIRGPIFHWEQLGLSHTALRPIVVAISGYNDGAVGVEYVSARYCRNNPREG